MLRTRHVAENHLLEALLSRQLRKAKEQWVDKQVARGAADKGAMEDAALEDMDDE